ncbi:MAG TPA: HD-GYP domain-containing protein [Actinomycetota bacterium]|nr:HD-GYP domain-containing protein [Actinomycetota bacterium]
MDVEHLPRRLSESIAANIPSGDYHRALAGLVSAVNDHDTYTAGHSCRVSDYSASLGRIMGLTRAEVTFMRQAGLVHDIGKIGIPERVLKKNGKLTDEELHLVRLHPILGASILSRFDGMERMIPVVLHHHERWDGTGYPSGLAGVDIPREARAIFVVDAFDAMTTDRPYGEILSTEEALEELRRCAGRQFDPVLVDALHDAWRAGLLDDAEHSTHIVL